MRRRWIAKKRKGAFLHETRPFLIFWFEYYLRRLSTDWLLELACANADIPD